MPDLSKVTLNELIALNRSLSPLEAEYKEVTESKDYSDTRKHLLLTNIFINKAKITFQSFGESISDINTIGVDSLVLWYNDFVKLFEIELVGEWWKEVGLCRPELDHMTNISFGQFIDAKMIVDGGNKSGQDKWEIVQYLMSIFCISRKQKYDYLYTNESNPQFIRQGKKDVVAAIKVSKWWDELNKYINDHYTVFKDSGDIRDNTDNMDEHMARWGWVNFLKTVAKTKAFDIEGSGMNSIDCVRVTKASEILVWASEEKEENKNIVH